MMTRSLGGGAHHASGTEAQSYKSGCPGYDHPHFEPPLFMRAVMIRPADHTMATAKLKHPATMAASISGEKSAIRSRMTSVSGLACMILGIIKAGGISLNKLIRQPSRLSVCAFPSDPTLQKSLMIPATCQVRTWGVHEGPEPPLQ